MTGARAVRFSLLVAWGCSLLATLTAAAAPATRVPLGPGALATIRVGRALYLECRPPRGEGRAAFLRKYLSSPAKVKIYQEVSAVAIPFRDLNQSTRRAVLLAIFREDTVDSRGWNHEVLFAGEGGQETLGVLSEWITGRSENYKKIMALNHLKSTYLTAGQRVLFPASMLSPVMSKPTPKRTALARKSMKANAGPELVYGKDRQGPYAEYRLKEGEALFTAVVIRFTDYRDTSDILKACAKIQARSGIKDVHAMATGQRVKIPLYMLADRYRPEGSEERRHYEESLRESRRLKGQVRTRDLNGVVVVIDPGHGGRDYGAHNARYGLYEAELNYDIACRVRALLKSKTHARVYMTMYDPLRGYRPSNNRRFTHDTASELLTTPHYKNTEDHETDARVSVNLRWYLANAIYRKELRRRTDRRKIIFTSFHCDALYDGMCRGTMVYIPGAAYRGKREGHSGPQYDRYAEVREHRYFSESKRDCRRDEALSRNFATALLDALAKKHIKIHGEGDPIRSQIRRSGGRVYVPGVLRDNLIPTKVLVEAANLTNAADCRRLADPAWRQRFAEAYVNALKAYFGS